MLGTETDSQDMDGTVIRQNDWSGVTEERLREAFASFVGDIDQVPPMVSAVKKGGERLYDLARKGQEIEREAKPITIHSIRMDRIELPYADFTVDFPKEPIIALCVPCRSHTRMRSRSLSLNRIRKQENLILKNAVNRG